MEDAGLLPRVVAESAGGGEDRSSSPVVQEDADIKFQPSVKIEAVENELSFPEVGTVSAPEECPESDSLEWTCSEVKCKEEDEDEEDKFQSPVKMEAGEDEYILPDFGTVSSPEGCPESDPLELTCSELECEEEDVPVLESPLSEDFKRFKRLIDLNKTCKLIAKGSEELVHFGDESAREPNASAQPCTETAEQAGPSSSGSGKPVPCPHCNYPCLGEDHLERHVKSRHGHIGRNGRHKCEWCEYSTDHAHHLRRHYMTHLGERPHRCEVCGKTFSRTDDLTRHSRIHTGDRPYKCEVCGKAFIKSSHLTTHRRIHTGEKVRQCKQCGASFNRLFAYTRHMQFHNDLKAYQCQVCSAGFDKRSDLDKHLRTHTGERPYACSFCPVRFKTQSAKDRHVTARHTHDYRHRCDLCGRGFVVPRELRRHLNKCKAGN